MVLNLKLYNSIYNLCIRLSQTMISKLELWIHYLNCNHNTSIVLEKNLLYESTALVLILNFEKSIRYICKLDVLIKTIDHIYVTNNTKWIYKVSEASETDILTSVHYGKSVRKK